MNEVGGYHELAALGPKGSNSHIVAVDLGRAVKQYGRAARQRPLQDGEIEPASMLRDYWLMDSFPSIAEKVNERRRSRGVVKTIGILPIVNTLGGLVSASKDTTNLRVIRSTRAAVLGIVDLPIEHCLLGLEDCDPEELKDRRVYSHPQALKQCPQRIHELGLKPENATRTSAAAAAVASGELGEEALAIAPRLAGEAYGLQTIAQDIGDLPSTQNVTVMAVMAKPDYRRYITLHASLEAEIGDQYIPSYWEKHRLWEHPYRDIT